MIPYGRRLVKLRGKKSQEEAAKGIGIATSTLGMYETERRIPRDSIKMAIAIIMELLYRIFFLPLNVTKKDKNGRE